MARPLRIQYENAVYHVTCRGNDRQDIFADDHDRLRFLSLLQRSSQVYQVSVVAFVLMRNHFHLLVRTPLANLQEFMRHFNISYTSAFNRRHGRSGHLYQGRYKSFLIDADSYLLEVSRYIHLNPVRVGGMSSPEEQKRHLEGYPWSSYPDYTGRRVRHPFLETGEVLDLFHDDRKRAKRAYRSFVEKALTSSLPSPLEKGRGHGIVGEKGFLEKVRTALAPSGGSRREVPQKRRLAGKTEPERILHTVASSYKLSEEEILKKSFRGEARQILMEMLYRHGGMNNREIGEMLGVDYSTVSVGRKRLADRMEHDRKLRRRVGELEDLIVNGLD
ncbi:MAG: hypothetical protein GXY80_09165 [Syntrophorhabdus aromaticivorans]|uniref:Transposase IS200-like domain-containing protein n=1 Tax=Syntrophorhabdus aromaticivorans TaxID=328301 RepID=A0A971M582_9BACT|nr:hypothetical protein [Syntrophorhabdus aromaticivorans]